MMDWEIRARQYAKMLYDLITEDKGETKIAFKMMREDGFVIANSYDWIENIKYVNERG